MTTTIIVILIVVIVITVIISNHHHHHHHWFYSLHFSVPGCGSGTDVGFDTPAAQLSLFRADVCPESKLQTRYWSRAAIIWIVVKIKVPFWVH